MADNAHYQTDLKLEEMEKRLSAIYSRAEKEIQKTADEYFSRFAKQDEAKRKLLEQGKITEDEYKKWRKGKVMYGKRFTEMKEQCAKQLLNVNKTSLDYVNGELPEVYSINYNALAGSVDGVGGYSFTLVDADTVRNLAVTDTSLLPYKELDPAKDIPWNMKKINAETLQGILQGESMDKIAKRIMNVQEMNKDAAIRSARTIVTGAECKGRQDSYQRAKDDGIILRKYWLATYDKRARDWHKDAGNDYAEEKSIEIDDFFIVDGEKMLHPGDSMHGASGHNLYNCRCSVASKVIGFKKVQVQKAMAEKPLYDIMGVSEKDIDISALPTETQKLVEDSVRRSVEKFPQLKGHFTKIEYDESIEAIASSKSITGSVKLSKKFKDYQKLQKDYDYDVRLGWHPKGTTAQSTITHEIGHQLDGLLTKKGIYGGSVSQYGVTRTSVAVQKEVLSRIGLSDERLREIRKQYSDMGYKGKDLNHAVQFERKEFIEKHICSYAAENSNEFFACLYAEYMDSPEPREAATVFGEILERIMGEIK